MKSVGATDSYVRFPFVVEGWLMGLVAGSISYGLMSLLYKASPEDVKLIRNIVKRLMN